MSVEPYYPPYRFQRCIEPTIAVAEITEHQPGEHLRISVFPDIYRRVCSIIMHGMYHTQNSDLALASLYAEPTLCPLYPSKNGCTGLTLVLYYSGKQASALSMCGATRQIECPQPYSKSVWREISRTHLRIISFYNKQSVFIQPTWLCNGAFRCSLIDETIYYGLGKSVIHDDELPPVQVVY